MGLTLLRTVPIYNCYPSIIVNSTTFILKCPNLDNKLYDHLDYRKNNVH